MSSTTIDPKTAQSKAAPASGDAARAAITAMRTLAMDAVQTANSGHPGTPVSLAPVVYTLFQDVMRYDPADPVWPNRDRFVLSAGHASMLLYGILHLMKVRTVEHETKVVDTPAVTLDDIKRFRQLGSVCAGHPEYRFCSGVETTTGPLGNGAATSVGMAIAGKWLAARYNRPGYDLFDYRVYALASDALLAAPDDRLESIMILFVAGDQALAEQAVAEFNRDALPYERIRKVHVVDRIPRTDLGKVKRAELLALESK